MTYWVGTRYTRYRLKEKNWEDEIEVSWTIKPPTRIIDLDRHEQITTRGDRGKKKFVWNAPKLLFLHWDTDRHDTDFPTCNSVCIIKKTCWLLKLWSPNPLPSLPLFLPLSIYQIPPSRALPLAPPSISPFDLHQPSFLTLLLLIIRSLPSLARNNLFLFWNPRFWGKVDEWKMDMSYATSNYYLSIPLCFISSDYPSSSDWNWADSLQLLCRGVSINLTVWFRSYLRNAFEIFRWTMYPWRQKRKIREDGRMNQNIITTVWTWFWFVIGNVYLVTCHATGFHSYLQPRHHTSTVRA